MAIRNLSLESRSRRSAGKPIKQDSFKTYSILEKFLLSQIVECGTIILVKLDSMGIVLVALFGNGKGVCEMNTLEVLTLVLVIFAVLTYLDNHSQKK